VINDRIRRTSRVVIVVIAVGCAVCATPRPATALNPIKPLCSAAGLLSGLAGKLCTVARNPGKLVSAGKKLARGHVGGALKTVLGDGGGGGSAASTAIGLAAIGAWVLGGAKFALHETARVLASTSRPQLDSTWFSSAYWRMAAVAALLTLPFLFAAAVQAMMRSDLTLLARAALGYLPLALLAVSVAAPITMLLLAGSDELAAIVSSAAGNAGEHFLDRASLTIGGLTIVSGSPFLAFLVGLFTAAGTLVLWLELLMREAAVYVIVLMLPLVFAALVWPARRVWAIRSVELLLALILSKFAIVAVLALGGAAMSHSVGHSVTGFLAGIVLVLLGAFAPWALLRLIPFSELASAGAGSLRDEARALRGPALIAGDVGEWAHDWSRGVTAGMRRQVQETSDSAGSRDTAHDAIAALTETVPGAGSGLGSGADSGTGSDSGGDGARPVRTDSRAADHGATRPISQAGQLDGAGPGAGSADHDGAAGSAPAGDPPAEGAAAGGPLAAGAPDGRRPEGGSPGGQRRPGMLPIWQAPDEAWEPLNLDLDQGWPPPSPSAGQDAERPASADSEPGPGPSAPAGDPPGGEDHDPRPPAQDPDEGRL